jgi:hypothetical protein
MPPPSTIDLSEIIKNPDQLSKLEFSRPETPEEHRARLFKMYVDMGKELIIALFVAVGVGVVLWYCVQLMESGSPDDKKWAQTVLAGAVTAGLGYLIGKRN